MLHIFISFFSLLSALILTTFLHDLLPRIETQLVEFVEYHREMGVTHFMMYDRTGTYGPLLTNLYTPDLITHITWAGIGQDRSVIYSKYVHLIEA